MLTITATIIFFLLAEVFALSSGFWFWLVLLLIFCYWALRKENHEDFQDISLVLASALIFFLNFILQNVLDISWIWRQIHVLILVGFFFSLLRFYRQPCSGWRKSIFPAILILATAFLGSWFFHAGILNGLFWKEFFLFAGLLIIFRAGQRVVFKSLTAEKSEDSRFLFPWAGNILAVLVLTELAWFLGFLPINFLSLAGIFLLCFFLVWEFFNWFWQKDAHFSKFLFNALLVIILIIIIMASANWLIV